MVLPAATMMSVPDWLEEQRSQEGDPEHIQAVEALALLLEDKASPLETAKSITLTYEATVRTMTAGVSSSALYSNKVCQFWTLHMCDAIQTFGSVETHERLMDLLVEVSRQPDVLDESGLPVTGCRDSIYWSDVPDWERALVDGLYEAPYSGDFDSSDKYLAHIPGHLNATRFAATLLERQLFTGGLPFEAACALNIGLEHAYDESSGTFGVQSDDWPALVPAAAIWLLVAGKPIYEHCVSGDISNGWERGKYSRERWDLWKKHLAMTSASSAESSLLRPWRRCRRSKKRTEADWKLDN